MKKLLFILLAFTAQLHANSIPAPPHIFDPGNACLIVGTPVAPGVTEITDYILRTPAQQQTLTLFDAFPAGTLNDAAGITIILGPRFQSIANKLSNLDLTVGNLSVLKNYSAKIFQGVIGIDSANVLAFGDSSFMNAIGIDGSPVQFFVENYDHTGIYANQFISDEGLNNGYRLGFTIEPKVARARGPSGVPETGSTSLLLLLAVTGLGILPWGWRKKSVRDSCGSAAVMSSC